MTDLVKEEQTREAAAAEAAAVLQTQKTETAAARVRPPSECCRTFRLYLIVAASDFCMHGPG